MMKKDRIELNPKAMQINGKPKLKTFKVRKFRLGEEIHIDRDELYSQRG